VLTLSHISRHKLEVFQLISEGRIKIASARMIGCQSHEDTLYDFCDGLNVFVADNQTGKSVFFKMTKIAVLPSYYNRKEREDLIRYGHECAIIAYTFTDSSCGGVRVFAGGPQYFYTEDYTKYAFEYRKDPHPDMVSKLGLLVDYTEQYIANLLDTEQLLLFVNSGNQTNNNLVKMLIKDERVDRMIVALTKRVELYREKANMLSHVLIPLRSRLADTEFIDIDSLEVQVTLCEDAVSIYGELIDVGLHFSGITVFQNIDYDSIIEGLDAHIALASIEEFMGVLSQPIPEEDLIYGPLSELAEGFLELDLMKVEDTQVELSSLLELIDAYSLLTDLTYQDTGEDDLFEVLDLVDTLRLGHMHSIEFLTLIDAISKSDDLILDLEANFSSKGRTVECPIYGRIQHVEGNCIPVDH
jgi:hypothetical protein